MIDYVLIVPFGEETTPFQGFNYKVADDEFIGLVHAASCFPMHAVEVYMRHEQLVEFRKGGVERSVYAIGEQTSIDSLLNMLAGIVVVLAPEKNIDHVVSAGENISERLIIVSDSDDERVIRPFGEDGFLFNCLDGKIDEIFRRNFLSEVVTLSKMESLELRGEYNVPVALPAVAQSVATPNQVCLYSFGYSLGGREELDYARKESYVDAILESAQCVVDNCGGEDGARGEVVIYAPSIYPELYNFNQKFWNDIMRKIKSTAIKDMIKNGVIRNEGYSGFSLSLEEGEMENPYEHPTAGSLLHLRQRELSIVVAAISLFTSSTIRPAVRLPNAVNLSFSMLKEIEELSKRGDEKGKRKLQKKFKEYEKHLRQHIGKKITDYICGEFDSCQLFADVPIEWVRFGKVPLMFSHDLSRIPMTPGNMLMQYCAVGGQKVISDSDLHDVLVIRSFAEEDEISGVLETAVECFLGGSSKVKCTFVDVGSKDDVVKALDSFYGNILVFDCHGYHGGPKENGWLCIGDEKLDTWSLAHKTRVPPIVLLSACLTSAIGGSHASVANGLIRSGAISVLGTFLPVDARKSALFVARILYRLEGYLPALKGLGFDMVSWQNFISEFMRMSYSTDVVDFLQIGKGVLSKKHRSDVLVYANKVINLGDNEWYEKLLSKLSNVCNIASSDIQGWLENEMPLMETMYYCHIGRPDNINIMVTES